MPFSARRNPQLSPRTVLPVLAALIPIASGVSHAAPAETSTHEHDNTAKDQPSTFNAAQAGQIADYQARFHAREKLVQQMADMTLSILQDAKKSFTERQAVMERGIANMVDIPWVARFALGNAWRSASDTQRQRYTQLYGAYLTKMYIANFAQDSGRKISDMKILGIADSQEDRFTARTEVLLSTGQRLHVDYLVRDESDTHQIIDITVEGVSLLTTHRAEFSEIASSQGVDGVIATLEHLVAADTPAMRLSMK